jgi:hypothetical protein
VTYYDVAGLVGGVAGAALFLLGVLIALLAALRILVVMRRPGKGRIARAIAAGGLVVACGGAALFWTAELAPFRRAVDRSALPAAGVVAALAIAAGWRVARRRPAAPPGGADPAPPSAPPPEDG